jgi:hypothetical protein
MDPEISQKRVIAKKTLRFYISCGDLNGVILACCEHILSSITYPKVALEITKTDFCSWTRNRPLHPIWSLLFGSAYIFLIYSLHSIPCIVMHPSTSFSISSWKEKDARAKMGGAG